MKNKAKHLGQVVRRGIIEFTALACLITISVCGGIAQVDMDSPYGGMNKVEVVLEVEKVDAKDMI